MPVKVTVTRKVDAPFSDARIREAVAAALRGARKRGASEISVALIGDAEMRKLNRAWRGKDRTTDVLSFSAGGGWPGGKSGAFMGDVLISVPQIRRQAKEYDRTFRQEFAMMLVHGTLHLLGYDHERPKDAARMLPLQDRILTRLRYA